MEVDLSGVAKVQKVAFWIIYWKTSNIATVVGRAAEVNGVHTTHGREPIDLLVLLPAAFGYNLGTALNENHDCDTSYHNIMPLDLKHLRSPIENVCISRSLGEK